MLSTLHKTSALIATGLIATFWTTTVFAELFLTRPEITAVKTAIPYGMILLVPMIATAGATGYRQARGRTAGVIGAKRRRMPIVAINGVLALVPAALFLSIKAQAGQFDTSFALVQAAELAAGAVNLGLMLLNVRDGRRMTAGRRRKLA